jgi:hypothetical protein
MKYLPGITHPFLDPITGQLSSSSVLPSLQQGYIWEGNADNHAQASTALLDVKIDIKSIFDASFVLKNKSNLFPNAQGLTALNNGLMRNNSGDIQTSITITLDELPNLGVATIEGLELPAGKIWRGTDTNRPEESDALSHAEADLIILNAKFYTGHFIMQSGLRVSYPAAQFLSDLPNGLLKHTTGKVAQAIPNEDYVYSVQTDQVLMGGVNNVPESRATIAIGNLPALQQNYVWQGNAQGQPEAQLLQIAPDDARYILQSPNEQLAHAQALNALVGLAPRLLKATDEGVIEVAARDEDYVYSVQTNQVLMGGANNIPESRTTITLDNLPALQQNYIWKGNAQGRPEAEALHAAPDDARYILQTYNNQLTNAQALNALVGLAPRILKANTDGVIEVAIRDEDYATKEILEQIKAETEGFKDEAQTAAQEASASAEEASLSATEASASAVEATGAAGEATVAAGEASASAAAAGLSAVGAGASAIAAAASASSASSSSSDAKSYKDDAQESASEAETALNTLLTTGITLTGDVYATGGLQNPIVTHFSDNPNLPGNAAMRIPGGASSDRPTQPQTGMLRYRLS